MISNKVIFDEVEELKNVLSQGQAEIPSFWACLWPGLVIVAWNMFSAVVSVDNNYLSSKYIFWVLVFPGVISLMVLLSVVSARSLFLSVPRSYRVHSQVYRFFTRKVVVYALVYMALIITFALYNKAYYASPFPFSFMMFLTTVFLWFIMNIDFGRYQLSLLTSAINTFKTEKLEG